MADIKSLKSDHKNARKRTDRSSSLIKESLERFGAARSIVIDEENRILAGNGTVEGAKSAGIKNVRVIETDGQEIIAVKRTGLSEEEKVGLALADNRTADLAEWDLLMLQQLSDEHDIDPWFEEDDLAELLGTSEDEFSTKRPEGDPKKLSDRFGVVPFSVLNAREGWWQERKRSWIALGIQSDLGREGNLLKMSDTVLQPDEALRNLKKTLESKNIGSQSNSIQGAIPGYYTKKNAGMTDEEIVQEFLEKGSSIASGTSIFDPVLAELAYNWFSPEDGTIIDPFAGGSVRGIVASKLGRKYYGVDLRQEQVEANQEQAKTICSDVTNCFQTNVSKYDQLTPVEQHGGHLVKRDDLFSVGGVNGGKVRTCWHLAQGAKGLVTAGSRESPQVNIVSHVAKALGIPCRVHTPEGELSPEVDQAVKLGADLFQHKFGVNRVIIKRAKDDAVEQGFKEIPIGMECKEAVNATKLQVDNIPPQTKRIVIPVGSGMSLSGLLTGLREQDLDIPVLGVRVGADPTKRLNTYAPKGWEQMVTLVDSDLDYHEHAPNSKLGDLYLDPVYEAKCLPFLEEGDLLWVVGIRKTSIPQVTMSPTWYAGDSRDIHEILADKKANMIFSCPPYADLEVYSDDPRDISNQSYEDFLSSYREIIFKACTLLEDDSFACFVVGEVRDKKGIYRNFVADTIQAFIDSGLDYYNEAILITAIGTLAIRSGRTFAATRKLGKTHQNVLVFVKGDPRKATQKCGSCQFKDPETLEFDDVSTTL